MMRKAIKIVIADDNREFCELLKEFLSQQDDLILVGIANNGLEALELIEKHSPDIIVLDIIMPHLDGIGVLEKLASGYIANRPRVIMLTAFGQETVTQRAVELGADYYILKPFDFSVLASRIRQLSEGLQVNQYITSVKPKNLDVAVTNSW